MDFETENELRPVLGHGERLLWSGRPKSGIAFRAADIYLIPFSLLWFGFAIFWVFMAASMGGGLFAFFGVPFIVIGFYISIGRFIADIFRRKKTVYGITDNRVIIKSGIFSQEIKSLSIRTMSDITLTEKADGSGTISLGPSDVRSSALAGLNMWNYSSKTSPSLEFIPDVKRVYDILIRVQREG